MTENDDLVLSLSIGGGGTSQNRRLSNPLQIHHSPLPPTSWDIHVASSMSDLARRPEIGSSHKGMEASEEDDGGLSSPNSAVSSVVSGGGKRGEREELLAGNGEENEAAGAFARGISDDEDGGEGSRKKLRLSKEQSAILEESFKEHNTLNPKQKIALAKQLNLRPRQVEVWFQNRRARTKLKQTEVDCELLKRCCENLTEENRRLQREVQELRTLKFSPQFYMQATPPTTLTMCPSCERLAVSSSSSSSSSGNPVSDKFGNLHRHLATAAGGSQVLPWPPSSLRS